jgi:hypothetical protein
MVWKTTRNSPYHTVAKNMSMKVLVTINCIVAKAKETTVLALADQGEIYENSDYTYTKQHN